MNNVNDFVKEIQIIFSKNQDDINAKSMSKYMLNNFEFYGIKSPLRKELQKDFLKTKNLPKIEKIPEIITQLWLLPQREFQYFAIDLLRKYNKQTAENMVDLFEYIILNRSWWDSVDMISSRLVGDYFKCFPQQIVPYTEKWIYSDNIWLIRTALLFQLNYKEQTNSNMLFDYILRVNGSKEFFINKAIGWALRQYSKTNAEKVIDFVEKNQLSNLSTREALKWMKNKGLIV